MKTNQRERIINYIKEFGSITSKDAYNDLGITQLSARIYELEREGFVFKKDMETGKNRFEEPVTYKRYFLADITAENMQHILTIQEV